MSALFERLTGLETLRPDQKRALFVEATLIFRKAGKLGELPAHDKTEPAHSRLSKWLLGRPDAMKPSKQISKEAAEHYAKFPHLQPGAASFCHSPITIFAPARERPRPIGKEYAFGSSTYTRMHAMSPDVATLAFYRGHGYNNM